MIAKTFSKQDRASLSSQERAIAVHPLNSAEDLHSIQNIDDMTVNTAVSSIPYFGFVPRVYRRISLLHPPVKKFRTLSFFRSAPFVISEFLPGKNLRPVRHSGHIRLAV
jgi:hypothetical protein